LSFAFSRSRSVLCMIFPVVVMGSSATNSKSRGYICFVKKLGEEKERERGEKEREKRSERRKGARGEKRSEREKERERE
jgi:hypothetical protein